MGCRLQTSGIRDMITEHQFEASQRPNPTFIRPVQRLYSVGVDIHNFVDATFGRDPVMTRYQPCSFLLGLHVDMVAGRGKVQLRSCLRTQRPTSTTSTLPSSPEKPALMILTCHPPSACETSLKCLLQPKQDIHGQKSPNPATRREPRRVEGRVSLSRKS